MADKLVPSVDDTGAVRRFRDMGDGTWAEVVAAVAAASAAGTAGYPAGAVPIGASGSGANSPAVATLAAAVGKTTYLTGLEITGGGATAAAIATALLAGIVGGAYNYILAVPASPVLQVAFVVQFPFPVPASAVNTAISLTVSAFGAGNTNVNVALHGFQV